MIPFMIQSGYRALAVTFDVWGLANLVKDGMNKARAFAEEVAATQNGVKATVVNGTK